MRGAKTQQLQVRLNAFDGETNRKNYTKTILKLWICVEKQTELTLPSQDGAASLGWHADDEALFQGKLEDISVTAAKVKGFNTSWEREL